MSPQPQRGYESSGSNALPGRITCEICKGLVSLQPGQEPKLDIDIQKLRALSKQSCYPSTLLLEAIEQSYQTLPPEERQVVNVAFSLPQSSKPSLFRLAFVILQGSVIWARQVLEFIANRRMTDDSGHVLVSRDSTVQIGRLDTGRHISSRSDADLCFELIKQWIETCIREHELCKASRDTPLPTLVICVGSADSPQEPFLLESGGRTGLYTTLSHCWGQNVVQKATKSNLEERKHAIPISTLNKTFRDAIEVTRWLGIEYLWIDSMCIIQDDDDDWTREASKMAMVYEGSMLTISATSARDGRDGFLGPRPVFGTRVESVRDELITNEIYIRERPSHRAFELGHDDMHRLSTDQAAYPALNRGWCHQERMLSPRVLHYTKWELV
jgi:Heterokaryon incompatibility protein (HET)